MQNLILKRAFHSSPKKPLKPKTSNQQASSFKTFFRLRPEDRHLPLWRKCFEVWRTNPVAKRITLGLKCIFALGFFYVWTEGVRLPGQRYMRLAEMQLRFYQATGDWKKEH